MPDISKCASESCPIRDTCYRFTSTPSPFRQAYADFKYDEETKNCDYYWDNKDYEDKETTD